MVFYYPIPVADRPVRIALVLGIPIYHYHSNRATGIYSGAKMTLTNGDSEIFPISRDYGLNRWGNEVKILTNEANFT